MKPGSTGKVPRRRASALEIGLLVVGLAVLALGAGAVGWAIGQGNTATRTVTVAAEPAKSNPTKAPAVKGNPVAGKAVFVNSGCGSCHTLAETGAKGTVGPNLDQAKLTPSEILDWVKNGKGAMPSFKAQLSEKDLADVVAFLAQVENR